MSDDWLDAIHIQIRFASGLAFLQEQFYCSVCQTNHLDFEMLAYEYNMATWIWEETYNEGESPCVEL